MGGSSSLSLASSRLPQERSFSGMGRRAVSRCKEEKDRPGADDIGRRETHFGPDDADRPPALHRAGHPDGAAVVPGTVHAKKND